MQRVATPTRACHRDGPGLVILRDDVDCICSQQRGKRGDNTGLARYRMAQNPAKQPSP
jgi:hypothetical protein